MRIQESCPLDADSFLRSEGKTGKISNGSGADRGAWKSHPGAKTAENQEGRRKQYAREGHLPSPTGEEEIIEQSCKQPGTSGNKQEIRHKLGNMSFDLPADSPETTENRGEIRQHEIFHKNLLQTMGSKSHIVFTRAITARNIEILRVRPAITETVPIGSI